VATGLVCSIASITQGQPLEGTHRFLLLPASTYTEGCYPPCACPIFTTPLRGSFDLTLISIGDVTDFYEITNVDFLARGPGLHLTGEGRLFV
jgi:hypothetical protein